MGPLGPQGPKGEDQQDLNDQEDLKAHQDIKVNCMGEMQVPTGPVGTRSSNTTCHCKGRKRISRGDPGLMGQVTLSGEKHERIMLLDQ